MIKWNGWEELLDEVREQHRRLSHMTETWREMKEDEESEEAGKRYHKTLERWDAIDVRLSGLREAISSAQADRERGELLDWLSSLDHSRPYRSAQDKHEAGTGNWLVEESDEFKSWTELPGSLLWLNGKGAGKGHLLFQASARPLLTLNRCQPGLGNQY